MAKETVRKDDQDTLEPVKAGLSSDIRKGESNNLKMENVNFNPLKQLETSRLAQRLQDSEGSRLSSVAGDQENMALVNNEHTNWLGSTTFTQRNISLPNEELQKFVSADENNSKCASPYDQYSRFPHDDVQNIKLEPSVSKNCNSLLANKHGKSISDNILSSRYMSDNEQKNTSVSSNNKNDLIISTYYQNSRVILAHDHDSSRNISHSKVHDKNLSPEDTGKYISNSLSRQNVTSQAHPFSYYVPKSDDTFTPFDKSCLYDNHKSGDNPQFCDNQPYKSTDHRELHENPPSQNNPQSCDNAQSKDHHFHSTAKESKKASYQSHLGAKSERFSQTKDQNFPDCKPVEVHRIHAEPLGNSNITDAIDQDYLNKIAKIDADYIARLAEKFSDSAKSEVPPTSNKIFSKSITSDVNVDQNKIPREREEKEGIFKSGFLLRSASKSPAIVSLGKEASSGEATNTPNKFFDVDEMTRVNNELNRKNPGSMFRPGFLLDRKDKVQDSSTTPSSGLKVGRFLVEDPTGPLKGNQHPPLMKPVSPGFQQKEEANKSQRLGSSANITVNSSNDIG